MKQTTVKPRSAVRIDRPYGRYRLVAGAWNGTCEARAFAGSQIVESVGGDTVEQAVQALEARLDARLQAFMEAREDAPSQAEYAEALHAVGPDLSSRQRSLLRAHIARPGHTASLSGLDAITRCGSVEMVATEYGRLGRLIGAFLSFKPKDPSLPRKLVPLLVVMTTEDTETQGGIWALRPAFARALAIHSKILGAATEAA
ncbi:MAG: hypothetical protein ACK4QW_18110 [Alphaproteobacteria bacterium]